MMGEKCLAFWEVQPNMICAEVRCLESNNLADWSDFERYQSPDVFDDYGWFHVTVGAAGIEGGNDFQVCVATPRAVGRAKQTGSIPGIIVDQFDAASVRNAINDRIVSVRAHTWEQIVDELRKFMQWEYEGMAGSS